MLTPIELGGSKKGRTGGNKTVAVVAYLLGLLPFRTDTGQYVVYLDNLFTSHPLLKYLRNRGWGATGTARTARVPFEDQPWKILPIPGFIDQYNHYVNDVDQGD